MHRRTLRYIQFCDSHVLSETYILALSFCLKKHKVIKDLLVKENTKVLQSSSRCGYNIIILIQFEFNSSLVMAMPSSTI